jgi:acyl-CoA thioesterase
MPHNPETIKHHFENDRFATSSGMRLVELRPGYAKTCLQVEERHLNSIGTVQGGAIFTLADFAFGAAVKTGGKIAPAISTNLS